MNIMEVGFYGKLPSHGDFVQRRVSEGFVDVWDRWLGECLPASRTIFGPRWLEIYLTSPVWRFVCAAGACGPAPVIGLMAPSVDLVGRYFPITIVAELAPDISLIAAAGWERFFDAAERLVIETLAPEHVNFERFDAGVAALGRELATMSGPPALAMDESAVAILTDTPKPWQLPLRTSSDLALAFEQLVSNQLEAKYHPLVLWSTEGSALVEPCCLVHKGLPDAALYPAFLDGSWAERRWRCAVINLSDSATPPARTVESAERLIFRSAGATDVGRARENNEDAFIERPEYGVWAVADGMGGHSYGEVASRMVCDALVDFRIDGTFDEAIDGATERVQQVNEFLLRTAADSDDSGQIGSTVVVLLMRGSRSAALWAGDSRLYRWRAGALEQLTRDHNMAELAGEGAVASNVITKAVGVEPNLSLDVYRDTVLPEDRFLLCSDGLSRVVTEADISSWMAHPDVSEAVTGLIRTTLDAGAPDNVTVVIAEVRRDSA